MRHPRTDFSRVAITGIAARLPGARTEEEFWQMLIDGRCAVGSLPPGRWSADRYFHPRTTEPGFSYTFAGGYLENPWDFDPSVFGISPREAAEMDPQQRLLLEVVWGALEDSGIPPSSLAGANVGVYVGASSLDYGNLHTTDPAAIESHFMTGNTLSIISNRISYIYDLRGPSFTVDTACSSSLVAFAEAQAAITSGRIDMAIVAGVNMLLSPSSFIGFSRASMLSPTGLCRPFSAIGDGYVRAEGAVAMVLARQSTAEERAYPIRAIALASGINSDGRTNGISLPSTEGQRELLHRLYGSEENRIDPNRLAFVEAHGTGTRVGDPAEASAIGEALGRPRTAPLPIGSVKSNIGHLEPASGLAGLYKAVMALEHRLLPRSLHADETNPLIDFADLNLTLAREPVVLPQDGTWLAGVSSFGFGGTNAHVVISQPEPVEPRPESQAKAASPRLLMLSAFSRPALHDAARVTAERIEMGDDSGAIAAAFAWQRDLSGHRLAVPLGEAADLVTLLKTFAETGTITDGIAGTAPSTTPKLCFVFSGNGSQWAGMGRAAFARNETFRHHFETVDALFSGHAGWSLVEALHDEGLAERMKQTRVAQPILFALQSSLSAALAAWGIKPDMVLGHSVGEVAAAEAAGALSLAEAVRVIFLRSEHQEGAFGLGTMAVAGQSPQDALRLIGESGLAGLELAALNSPSSVTISGPVEEIRAFSQFARKRRVAVRALDLAYPFHSALLEPLRQPLLDALGTIETSPSAATFLSTVTGEEIGGEHLDADYWWRNVREPVRFRDAVASAARRGATVFIEIGPRPILTANIADTLDEGGFDGAALTSLSDKENAASAVDPLLMVAARALVLGCRFDSVRLFGPRPVDKLKLPAYPWQHKAYKQPETSEALDIYGTAAPRHPLIGARLASGTPEWRNLLDAATVPYLADHRIDGEIIVPGSAFAEMALAAAREIFPEGPIGLEDFDLLQWLPIPPGSMKEVSVRLSGDTQIVEIWSRPRLGEDEWTLCARGRITRIASPTPAVIPRRNDLPQKFTAEHVYASATRVGVDYGPLFQRVLHASRDETLIEVDLSPFEDAAGLATRPQVLHPIALDSAFHAMFENIKAREGERYAFLPVRFARLRVDRDGGVPARARIFVDRETDHSLSITVDLYDADGAFIAGLGGGLFRAVTLDRRKQAHVFFHESSARLLREGDTVKNAALAALKRPAPENRPDSWLILEAFSRSLAWSALRGLSDGQPFDPAAAGLGEDAQAWALTLLNHLHSADLADETPDGWVLADESGLPEAADILTTFAAEFAGATPEIVLAAQALAGLEQSLAKTGAIEIRPALLEQFETSSILFSPLLSSALALCEAVQTRIAPEPLRILVAEPSCLGLLRTLSPLVRQGRAVVTVIGTDARRVNLTAARRGPVDGCVFEAIDGEADETAPGQYDLALAFAFGPVFNADTALGRALARRLAPGGLLCAFQPDEALSYDLLLGAAEGWFPPAADPSQAAGRVRLAQDSARLLVSAGFGAIDSHVLADGMGTILLASTDRHQAAPARTATPTVIIERPSIVMEQLALILRMEGAPLHRLDVADIAGDWVTEWAVDDAIEVIFPAVFDEETGLDQSIAQLATLLDTLQGRKGRLWLITRGRGAAEGAGLDPRAEALWCFLRVAINEYPGLQIKLVDQAPMLDPELAARRLADLLKSPVEDSELLIDGQGVVAVRVLAGLGRGAADAEVPAVRIELRTKGMLSNFDWIEMARRAPGPREVEVAVDSSGLNFRDIMLATGLLDDDVLDDGLAGAVFGFECAGRVVAVGSDVTELAIGDAVTGFGRQSFASHSTADVGVFTKLPDEVPLEAAATIPVAFLTAWYALVHQARLQPGEWVLIHGAAGGVGLAAMQIARLFGARIAATVSTPDKRALAKLYGAEKIYNSRSTAFLDEIRQDLGGVDVVLNSLAGEAMLASVKCLKPFGRFIELGKRDYVLNTAMGLRPFRRNLTYYGVDLDQLLAANLPLAQKLMGELMTHFSSGALAPLPYRSFEWFEAGEAFQLMQAAGHVGKIVVRPAARPIATHVVREGFKAGDGCHLVVGGAGGFGFETVAWLAEKGAKTIVVASRRGTLEAGVEARAAALRAKGVTLLVEALDVTDGKAVDALIQKLTREHGRVAGVMHAAMVLDDGMISGLEPARTRKVLAPKVEGADHLDRATRNAGLDYFVAFSSVTTMIGNPGQGAYVAANGYLQGLMRRRRALGLPGLAVGWGAIGDVGILARDAEGAAKLERISGIIAMRAAEALSHLEGLLTRPDACPDTVYCASFRPGAALQGLKLLGTPAFGQLFAASEGGAGDSTVDIASLVAGKGELEARGIIATLVAQEVARILRLTAEDIDVTVPLDDLGMDSLMSLELRMGIEARFGVELPVVAISSGVNVNELATRLIAGAAGDSPAEEKGAGDLELKLMQQHGPGDVDLGELKAVTDAIEESRSSVKALL
jgi:acyl transferase domain-containing protein/NADPH:quinone reductase-like Zn-dependent oxidoreductase/acyl carrier protein